MEHDNPGHTAQGHPQNPNHSIDYDSWVNSLGSIQDSMFQNTPMTSHILQHSSFNGIPLAPGQMPTVFQPQIQDADIFYNSPERFYRDIINESPIISRTPQVGRTPLRNLSINFSTPNFLKNLDPNVNMFGSATKGLTPLKAQRQFHTNEIFQTPNDTKENKGSSNDNHDHDIHQNHNSSTNLNSSPTTIKMGSSAVKAEATHDQSSKLLPPSPTPGSKSTTFLQSTTHPAPVLKMGCFKKTSESDAKVKTKPKSKSSKSGTSNFQIIMTDVNSFANNTKPSRRKKKLTRSSTVSNTSKTNNTINKKSSLKRTLSQPQPKLDNNLISNTPISQLPTFSNNDHSHLLGTPLMNRFLQATPVQYRTHNPPLPYNNNGTPGRQPMVLIHPHHMKMIQQQQQQQQQQVQARPVQSPQQDQLLHHQIQLQMQMQMQMQMQGTNSSHAIHAHSKPQQTPQPPSRGHNEVEPSFYQSHMGSTHNNITDKAITNRVENVFDDKMLGDDENVLDMGDHAAYF